MKLKFKLDYMAPWEISFNRILTPLEEFIHRQTTSAVLLMFCAVVALLLANSDWNHAYHSILNSTFVVGTEGFQIAKSVHHWINDGLMAIFFFVVGLELKRELLVGELADLKQAIFPIVAAIGGMVVPVAIYFLFNPSGVASDGWGIPMATDIAFALGTLALLGSRIPKSLLTFLVALAIVDDLGAVTVIALFYTDTINIQAILLASVTLFVLVALNLGGIRRPTPYVILGIILWAAMLASGIHATLAGIFLAFTIPMKPKYDPKRFSQFVKDKLTKINSAYDQENNILKNDRLRSEVRELENAAALVQAPAQMMERSMHLPSAYIIIPIFALANAGISLSWESVSEVMVDSLSLGIAFGLVLGKLIGIAGFAWLAVKFGLTKLPSGLNFNHIIGVGFMGGIGFTMSIFIAELGFAAHPQELIVAKSGILLGSLVAGVFGFLWLYFTSEKLPLGQQNSKSH